MHYLIERQDLSVKGGWHSVAEVATNLSTYKVEDLVHKKEYKFRVKAVNKFGAGIEILFKKFVIQLHSHNVIESHFLHFDGLTVLLGEPVTYSKTVLAKDPWGEMHLPKVICNIS